MSRKPYSPRIRRSENERGKRHAPSGNDRSLAVFPGRDRGGRLPVLADRSEGNAFLRQPDRTLAARRLYRWLLLPVAVLRAGEYADLLPVRYAGAALMTLSTAQRNAVPSFMLGAVKRVIGILQQFAPARMRIGLEHGDADADRESERSLRRFDDE